MIPTIIAASLAVLALSTSARAAEVASRSRIDAVTVFPSGAEVTRLAKVKIEKGEHAIVFSDLPASAVPNSIRVEGKATGPLEIGSVDTRRHLVPRSDNAEAERKKLEDELEKLRDARGLVEGEAQAAETQKKLIENLTNLPSRPAPNTGAEKPEDWQSVLATIANGTIEANKRAIDTRAKLRDLDRQIAEMERRIQDAAPLAEERTEVKVLVTAGAALEADLVVRYQVPHASWTPVYDARLVTAEKAGGAAAPADKAPPGKLTLVRRAAVTNRSEEDWSDVGLKLSTTRPGRATAPRQLEVLTVDYVPDAPPPPPPMPAPMVRSAPKAAMAPMAEMADGMAAAVEAKADVTERQAAADMSSFQTVFEVPGRHSVARSAETRRVQIDSTSVDVPLTVRVVPRLDLTAFLMAKLEVPATGSPLLPGQISLFRDGVFVGTGALPALAPGETHEMGFGADDHVKVKRLVMDNKKGETGILSTSSTDDRSFLIKVQNLHRQPMPIQVLDRVPVSQQKDIKVDVTTKLAPAKTDFEDKRGIYSWEYTAAAGEERQIAFSYRVSWPSGKKVQFREFTGEDMARFNIQTR